MACGCNNQGQEAATPIFMNSVVPHFSASMFNPISQEIETFHYRPGQWTIIFFYPADFTFVCPTELAELAGIQDELKSLGAELYGASVDTAFSHLMWLKTEKLLSNVKFSILSDIKKELSTMFGVLNGCSGLAMRGTIIINPKGKLAGVEIVPDTIGRSAAELLRKISAMKLNFDNPNVVCPATWTQGSPGLDKSQLIIGDMYSATR